MQSCIISWRTLNTYEAWRHEEFKWFIYLPRATHILKGKACVKLFPLHLDLPWRKHSIGNSEPLQPTSEMLSGWQCGIHLTSLSPWFTQPNIQHALRYLYTWIIGKVIMSKTWLCTGGHTDQTYDVEFTLGRGHTFVFVFVLFDRCLL